MKQYTMRSIAQKRRLDRLIVKNKQLAFELGQAEQKIQGLKMTIAQAVKTVKSMDEEYRMVVEQRNALEKRVEDLEGAVVRRYLDNIMLTAILMEVHDSLVGQ